MLRRCTGLSGAIYRCALQVFAPANLRAAADNKAYSDFVSACIAEKYTLRYTGGFVPDVHHILTKVGNSKVCAVQQPSPLIRACILYFHRLDVDSS